MPRLSSKTMKKLRKTKKSKSKTKRNKKHISQSLKTAPLSNKQSKSKSQYYYSQSSSYSSIFKDGKKTEHGLEVIDSSNSNKMLVRKLNNGKIVESMVSK